MSGDVTGFYRALGVNLPAHGGPNLPARCFPTPAEHRNGDRTPSCSVSVESGAFQCHGCGTRGGPYDAALALGRSRRAAMELLRRFGLASDDAGPARPRHSCARRARCQR